MIFKVNFVWNAGSQGWTETYYREADDARKASDVGGAGGILPWLQVRPPYTDLLAIRASEVDVPQRMYLRIVRSARGIDLGFPDVTETCAKVQLDLAGGGYHTLYCRGLSDDLVKRTAKLAPDPNPFLRTQIRKMIERMQELNFRGRRVVSGWQKYQVLQISQSPDEPSWSIVRCRHWRPSPGTWFTFLGKGCQYSVNRNARYLVLQTTDDGFVFANFNTCEFTTEFPEQLFVRQLEYQYPLISGGRIANFTKHSTGPRYYLASWSPDDPQRTPINPCGQAVDTIRVPYRTQMRFYGSYADLKLPVQWYLVPDDRSVVPYVHPFGSSHWSEFPYEMNLGETGEKVVSRGPVPTGATGMGLCGSFGQWLNGAIIGDRSRAINPTTGQPCCCGRGNLPSRVAGVGGPVMATGQPIALSGGGVGVPTSNSINRLSGGVGYVSPNVWRDKVFPPTICGVSWYYWEFLVDGAQGSFEKYNGIWRLAYDSGTKWTGTIAGDDLELQILSTGNAFVECLNTGIRIWAYLSPVYADCLTERTLAQGTPGHPLMPHVAYMAGRQFPV